MDQTSCQIPNTNKTPPSPDATNRSVANWFQIYKYKMPGQIPNILSNTNYMVKYKTSGQIPNTNKNLFQNTKYTTFQLAKTKCKTHDKKHLASNKSATNLFQTLQIPNTWSNINFRISCQISNTSWEWNKSFQIFQRPNTLSKLNAWSTTSQQQMQ